MFPFRAQHPESRDIRLRELAEDLFAQLRKARADALASGAFMRGQHLQRSGGPGHEFWQYREFQGGDSSRTIDWRQSARTDRILIRQKEKEAQHRSTIWIDTGSSMQFSGDAKTLSKYDCACVMALVVALLGRDRHDPVSLSGAGPLSVDDMTHVLTERIFQSSADDLGGHDIILLGDFLSPIEELRRTLFDAIGGHKRVFVVQILDPAEIDLPYNGRIVFETPDSGAREQILDVAGIRAAYQHRLQTQIDDVRSYALSRSWSYHFIRTGQDYLPALLEIALAGEDP